MDTRYTLACIAELLCYAKSTHRGHAVSATLDKVVGLAKELGDGSGGGEQRVVYFMSYLFVVGGRLDHIAVKCIGANEMRQCQPSSGCTAASFSISQLGE